MLGIYLHVPFCQAICSYCNFNRGLLDAGLKRRYVEALAREIREAGDGQPADTIFFGGGTPSLLEPAEVRGLIAAVGDAYRLEADAEITLETNPETVTPERLAAFRDTGVNRISFGVQSFDDAELQRLGRLHSAARAKEAVRSARDAGFANLSFDLMFWLPGQSIVVMAADDRRGHCPPAGSFVPVSARALSECSAQGGDGAPDCDAVACRRTRATPFR